MIWDLVQRPLCVHVYITKCSLSIQHYCHLKDIHSYIAEGKSIEYCIK